MRDLKFKLCLSPNGIEKMPKHHLTISIAGLQVASTIAGLHVLAAGALHTYGPPDEQKSEAKIAKDAKSGKKDLCEI